MTQSEKNILRSFFLLGIVVGAIFESQAQEVLTKTNGGASWETPSDDNGIYSGDGTAPSDVDVTVTDNIDFDAGTLFIDGANDEVGVGTTSPTSTLDVNGAVSMPSRLATSGTNFTLGTSDYTFIVTSISAVNVTLPNASDCSGRIYRVNKFSAGNGTISSYVSSTGPSTILPSGSWLVLQSIGGSWRQINN